MRIRTKPLMLQGDYCRIGEPPLSDKIGQPISDMYKYMNCWTQNGQIFTYQTGIDDIYGDSTGTSENGSFWVILPASNKNDTDNADRHLEGVLIPWFCEPTVVGGAFTQLVTVTWQQAGGSVQTLYESSETMESGNPVDRKGFQLKSRTGTNKEFAYTPNAGGDWMLGQLVTKGIHTAALGIWSAPDRWLTDKQALVKQERVSVPDVIRGINSTTDKESLGHFIEHTGADSTTQDGMLQNATRCVWQYGHAAGIGTETNSYQTVGTSGVEYKLYVPDLYPTSTLELYPTAYITTSGATALDKAYLKLTAEDLGGGADTWILEIQNDGSTLYDPFDATPSDDLLLCAVGAPTKFSIELMAPSSGYIVLHTLAIWAQLWETP